VLSSEAYLFAPEPTDRGMRLPADGDGGSDFRGEDAPRGAVLTYYLEHHLDQPVKIAIATQTGRSVATITGTGNAGLNREVWDLQPSPELFVEDSDRMSPPRVAAGTYRVTLTCGSVTQTQTLTVLP
jgi:hypothetical protein